MTANSINPVCPEIHVMPIKKLLTLDVFLPRSIAILNSSEPVDTAGLPIPSCFACYQDLDYESPRSFSPALAEVIAQFVKTREKQIDHIYVCCQAAQSRSPGVAAALYSYFGRDPLEIFRQPQYQPNVLCYRLLAEALGVAVTDEQIDSLIYENMQAFRNAIRQGRGT